MVLDVRDFRNKYQEVIDDYCDYLIDARNIARKKPIIHLDFPKNVSCKFDFINSFYTFDPETFCNTFPIRISFYAETDEAIEYIKSTLLDKHLVPEDNFTSVRDKFHNTVFQKYTDMIFDFMGPVRCHLTKITSKRFELKNNEALLIYQVLNDKTNEAKEYYFIIDFNGDVNE